MANSVKEAVSSRKSLIDRRGNVEYTRGNSATQMTVQLVHFGVGELAGVRSTAAWTGLTFESIRKDSKSHRNEKLPTARAWSIDRHVPPPVGHMMGGMERLDCDDTGTCLRGESSKNRVESWTNWLSADEPGFMFLCGVDGPVSSVSPTSTVLLLCR